MFLFPGHHIGERAHLIEREQNYYTGDAEERQEFINLEEEEAEDFDRWLCALKLWDKVHFVSSIRSDDLKHEGDLRDIGIL